MRWRPGSRASTAAVTEPRPQAAVVRRLLPATPDVVYDEWLDPAALADWMCPRPARCRNVASEPRVGGSLRIDIEDGGTEFSVSGQYLVLDRPRRLSFTWSCSTWPDPSVKSVVTVLLEPREHRLGGHRPAARPGTRRGRGRPALAALAARSLVARATLTGR
jgi:uncharacterized protein YndB with AHSA1/START domain